MVKSSSSLFNIYIQLKYIFIQLCRWFIFTLSLYSFTLRASSPLTRDHSTPSARISNNCNLLFTDVYKCFLVARLSIYIRAMRKYPGGQITLAPSKHRTITSCARWWFAIQLTILPYVCIIKIESARNLWYRRETHKRIDRLSYNRLVQIMGR